MSDGKTMRVFAGTFGLLARLAALAVIVLGARSLAPDRHLLATLAIALAMLVSSSIADVRHRIGRWLGVVASWVVLSAAAVAPARHAFGALGANPWAAWSAASAVSAGIGAAYARTIAATRRSGEGVGAAAIERLSTWLSASAILVAFGAEALHAHSMLPGCARIAAILGGIGSLLALHTHHRRPLGGGFAVFATPLLAAAALAATFTRIPTIVHPSEPDSVTLTRTLPSSCLAPEALEVTFVALSPLRVIDVEALAARYRRALGGAVEVRVGPSLPMEDSFFDPSRRQLAAEEVLAAACRAWPCHDGERRRLVIVVTDRDLFMRGKAWRFAFATSRGDLAIVSLARMDPAFPLVPASSYEPSRPACDIVLKTRAYKLITRVIARDACGGPPTDAPASVRRRMVLSLGDLDAIDEQTW